MDPERVVYTLIDPSGGSSKWSVTRSAVSSISLAYSNSSPRLSLVLKGGYAVAVLSLGHEFSSSLSTHMKMNDVDCEISCVSALPLVDVLNLHHVSVEHMGDVFASYEMESKDSTEDKPHAMNYKSKKDSEGKSNLGYLIETSAKDPCKVVGGDVIDTNVGNLFIYNIEAILLDLVDVIRGDGKNCEEKRLKRMVRYIFLYYLYNRYKFGEHYDDIKIHGELFHPGGESFSSVLATASSKLVGKKKRAYERISAEDIERESETVFRMSLA